MTDENVLLNSAKKHLAELLIGNDENWPNNILQFFDKIGLSRWEKVNKLALSVLENRFTVCESGHGVGKSITVAAIACYWMIRKGPKAKVVTLAPTHSQVNNVLWRYIRSFNADNDMPGKIFETPRWDIEPDWHAIGLSPRKDSTEALQALHGYHSPHLLVIMDEAPGLPRPLWEAVRGLVTSAGNRVIALGNPLEQAGPFWEACNSETWEHIHISCMDHPNVLGKDEVIPGAVTWGWCDEMVKDHCTRAEPGAPGSFKWGIQWYIPSANFQSRVLGQAPSEASDQLISVLWVNSAIINEAAKTGRPVIGFDPARYGGDMATMVCRYGNHIDWVKRRKPATSTPSQELAGWLKQEMFDAQAQKAFIDEIGIGAGVLDSARALGLPVVGVGFGRQAQQSQRYANLRAECWWRVREWMQSGDADIPDDDLLRGDLTTPKYHHDTLGRIIIESKEQIKSRLNRSPDSGDALALTFAYPTGSNVSISDGGIIEIAGSRWTQGGIKGNRWSVKDWR